MSESKGISLRRKKTTRPTISAPRQLSRPRSPSADSRQNSLWETRTNDSGKTNLTVPGEDGKRGREKTSDLVKRRYSTRIAGQPLNYQDGAPPPMPTMPAQFAMSGREASRSPSRDGRSPERRGVGAGGALQVDMRALKDPNLQAEKYVQSILADATEADIYAYQNDLQGIKAHASTDLQHNVYQNRTQFIKISKEADKLKSEMRTLRTLMSELTSALGQATSAGNSDMQSSSTMSVAERKRANRSSVANLEAMWSTHLQVLWKRVEGSQKYLPALPGRHIILESQRWVELNAATWKPRRRVAIVLLNDHLLIASEKKRNDLQLDNKNKRQSVYQNGQSQTTLVAERCWPLQDVQLADISSAAKPAGSREHKNIANALNIRVGAESFTYATSDAGEKAGFLVAFRKAQEDMRKQIAAEHGERSRQLDDLGGRADGRLLKKAAADDDGGGLQRSNSVLVDAEGRQQSIRAVEAQIDTLDIDIALQHFSSAVTKIESLRKMARSIRSNAKASELILQKVNSRATRLSQSISRQLTLTSAGLSRTKEHVGWLLRLGFEELARTTYLSARTETIRTRTRALPFTGPLPPYLKALSYATFTLLLHTFRTFHAAFPPAAGSSVVKWARERVEEFNGVLEQQLSSLDRDGTLWRECLEVVKNESKVLAEVGVDFRGVVARNLTSDLGVRDGASWGEEGQGGSGRVVGLGVSGT